MKVMTGDPSYDESAKAYDNPYPARVKTSDVMVRERESSVERSGFEDPPSEMMGCAWR